MASATLVPKTDASGTLTIELVSTSESGSVYRVSGRDLSVPYGMEVRRVLTQPSATGNDHIKVRLFRTEKHASTNKPATMQVLLDISVPKDNTVLNKTEQRKLVVALASLLGDCMAVTNYTNVTKLLDAMDL